MTFSEKSVLVNVVALVVGALAYAALVIPLALGTPVDQIAYQPLMVVAVVLLVVIVVAGHVVVAVTRPAEATAGMDERERLIGWRGQSVGGYVLAVGVFTAICLAMVEVPWFWIANVLAAMWVLAEVVAGLVKLTLFRRGV
jgi:hypothetical protein